ncbi:DNA-3-methyladenine glycosylase [Anoxybacillus gonensis]|uniref:DNA-3-methyladenine glycosylase II n=1 Tax=Anoxybacillus gonensis TaxID=198467 RepID=A0AAW7TN41_9BACL|nr:DNA-3-methyladenine glycosylase [Anoxybacillus gonensis]AKS37321.1 DNA-3-methyladenine glycosylase [Anoxybacillus gonensis]EMI11570.1 3-methyladenine DNA glycosylase [Anoxybacillus gonensis]KGP61999.1 DNA-3-methyladenine glycosylase [Anoxybacillus gonensis]MCX8045874.1 DNA-3-methyladenine glycosylase [Anoxybacillus gonensis]MDO0878210.1 DNA-3-methyladenine glycosylase [Anoxybacillus gonensis]
MTPYDFTRVCERLARDPLVRMQHNEIAVPLYVKDTPVVVYVKSTGTKENPSFVVSCDNEQHKEEAIARISRIFHWDRSLAPIHDHFMQTNLRDLFIAHEGTPIVLEFDLYFCLIKCIIHQQIHMKVAYRLTERFVHTFGERLGDLYIYPRPERIANASYDELRALSLSERKAQYIVDISRLIVEGKLRLEEMHSLSDEEVAKQLLSIRGIGPWTVQNFLLFGLGRPNVFPKGDVGLQRAIERWFQLDHRPTAKEMEAFRQMWEPYASYATFYLWRSIE